MAGQICAGIKKSAKEKEQDVEEAKEHVPTDVAYLKDTQGIPDFWQKAILNNQMMLQYIREKDRDTLNYITNVTTVETLEPPTITVNLTFKENEYFTNQVLSLKARFRDDDKQEVVETEGTVIDWKDGKDLTKKKIKKKQKNKKTGETRQIVKTVDAQSFFRCFESRKAPEKDSDSDEEDEETNKLLDDLDEAMQVALDFDDLYQFEALEYYLNFGPNPGEDFMGLGGDDEDDDEDQADEKPKKKPGKKDESGAGGEEGKQECKQQ